MSHHKSQFGFTPTPTLASLHSFSKSVMLRIMRQKDNKRNFSTNRAVKTRPMLVAGFTIIELLLTLGIFTMMTSVVLVNYRSFNNNSGFTNAVEDVYLALREAQVYGSGGRTAGGTTTCGNPASSFNCAYGVHFVNGSGSYNFFVDINQNRIFDTGTGELIQTISLGSGTTVTSLWCVRSGTSGACGTSGASVTFMRPSPDAFISEVSGVSAPANSLNGVEVTIKGIKTAKVVISGAGQISIQ